ncbi:YSIRK-type signal peptide-containing protein [uncultured Ligilactobacillus sp.]|uniref:YSIRK-type signal peptide-containing protein n=1 Tax=uncultured Ligilactobacillus sp. TaxID=2837633 RepID=UPI00272A5ED1|nr:YSIRK-type signal peptide-containing protein [uncultured Ligilactobacillus sp.]
MVSKKNRQLQLQRQAIKKNRYTIKRLSIGVASVLVGVGLSFGGNTLVKADMADTNIEQTDNNDPLAQQKEDKTSTQGISNDVIQDPASEKTAASSLANTAGTDKETSEEKISQVPQTQNVADKEATTTAATVESSHKML